MLLAVVLFGMTAARIALSESAGASDDQLTGEIKYRFVGHLEQVDEKGLLLVWEAQVAGDIQGTMKWWFVNPPPVSDTVYAGGRLSFYTARWELWYEEGLLLAGVSAGKTDFRDGADGIWDGHGRVTEARGKYESLKGRSVYESGPVILGSEPPATLTGTGVFLIY
jgi:hypothetical protein